MPRLFYIVLSGIVSVPFLSGLAQEDNSLDAAMVQTKLQEWIKTEQLISREQSEWEAGKATLQDLNQIRSEETKQLREFGEAAKLRVSEIAEKRASFAGEKEELRQWRKELSSFVSEWEKKLKPLVSRFPPPLEEKIEPSLKRFKNPEPDVPLQNRVRDILLITQAAVSFDGTITVDSDLREIEGETREVQVLYLGLNRAWYATTTGSFAGHGQPTAEGWKWTEDNRLAATVREAIDIQRRAAPPAMVTLPFTATGEAGE